MTNTKCRFLANVHSQPEKLVTTKPFKVRVALHRAIVAYLAPLIPAQFDDDSAAAGLLAQQLAFLPTIKSGWGPTERDIQDTAKNLVDGYLAHREAFACEAFPVPGQAALAALGDVDIAV